MANLAFISYAIEGEEKDIKKLDELFKGIISKGYNTEWKDGYYFKPIMQELAPELNVTFGENTDFCGILKEYELNDGVIYLETESVGHNNFDFEDLLKKYAPSINIFYYCDTDGEKACNDTEQKYFECAYCIDYYLEDGNDLISFKTLEEFLEYFNKLMKSDCKTFDEAEDFALEYEDDEYFINVYDTLN